MLFNSYKFIFLFLPLVLLICKKIKREYLLPFIVIISFYFYSFAGHKWFLIPMLITTVLDFLIAPQIEKSSTILKKRSWLIFSLTANLGLLFYFKYSFLIASTIWGTDSEVASLVKVILPAGISFYTFQTISYIVDVYRGVAHVEKNFWKFAGFVSFFPHLVAGPLTRHNQLIPELEKVSKQGIKIQWEDGLFLFIIGLSKKVIIADRIAEIIDPLLNQVELFDTTIGWLTILGYTMQIYFDFSGYSDMAIGLARLFGITLPQNFNSPYKASNLSDFWRRWHMSLSLWLKDYLYISLGGNKKRRSLNLFLTMVLGGLWHGANWTFAIWGAYHGLLLIISHSFSKTWNNLPPFFQRVLTFILVVFGWLFFRAKNFYELKIWIKSLFGLGMNNTTLTYSSGLLATLIIGGILVSQLLPNASQFLGFKSLKKWQQAALAIMFVFTIMLMKESSKFLYFQF